MMPSGPKLDDAVTGQCNHIIGFHVDEFPQFGGDDRLIRANEQFSVGVPFTFCPLCGLELTPSTQGQPTQILPREPLQLTG